MYGEEVKALVVNVRKEMNQYNASGDYPIEMLWHPLEDRHIDITEAIELIVFN